LLKHKFVQQNSKICYSANPRRFDNEGNISGGLTHIKKLYRLFFDIEFIDDKYYNDDILDKYVNNIISYLKRYNLTEHTLIHSGGGRHLIYNIPATQLTLPRKRWFSSFIHEIGAKFKHDFCKIDLNATDVTRILGLPGTLNVKRNKVVKLVRVTNAINTKFKIKSKREEKYKLTANTVTYIEADVKSNLKKIMEILKHPLPVDAPTNGVLFFNFKLLLSKYADKNNIPWSKICSQFKDFVKQVERIQKYTFPMNQPKSELFMSKTNLNKFCEDWKIEGVKF